jgi:hypothetical protein
MNAVQIRVNCIPSKVFTGKDLNMRAGLWSNRDEELPAVYLAFFIALSEILELMSHDHLCVFSKAWFSRI